MKKIFTLTMLAMAAMSGYAQYNLFDAADCDADGWLWFDTEEKISKYVGVINEDDYTVDPQGKPIQLAYANIQPTYPESYADPDVYGVDKSGTYIKDGGKTDEVIKGAIVLANATGSYLGSTNGGCMVLNLPSCYTIGLYLSCENTMFFRTLKLSPNVGIDVDNSSDSDWTGDTKCIAAYMMASLSIASYGHFKWEEAATTNNGYNSGETFVSDGPVYFCFQNCRNKPIYIHGIKVTTPKQESLGISRVAANQGKAEYFTLDGRRMQQAHGLTIVRENGVVRKVLK